MGINYSALMDYEKISSDWYSHALLSCIAFITPVMNYERENTSSFLVCSVLSVYPRPHIIWKMDSAFISESQTEEVEYLGPFSIRTILNITGSNSTYECTIENPLLKQTWTGRWTREDLSLSDSGEYLCNISSKEYTLLTVHTLHIEPSQGIASWTISLLVALSICMLFLTLIVKFHHEWKRYLTDSNYGRGAIANQFLH
ncbi:HERV-H LTR-associating protein 2 [Fukomys damarensis]|uniref:HERV-H LTR-associating protein 2 n=1 Tax=Fukomys damarensis TaxID=885580 RepID=UPI0008FED901|nr:HERV-H LTR-associating protein 2 [Fukomys damarensis]